MNEFQHGPFTFSPASRGATINGQAHRVWRLFYGPEEIGSRTLPDGLTRDAVCDALGDARAAFISAHLPAADPEPVPPRTIVQLVRSTETTGVPGEILGTFEQRAEITGLTSGLLDDRYDTWLITGRPMRAMPMEAAEFERLRAAHVAIAEAECELAAAHRRELSQEIPPCSWITGLLPWDVLTRDPAEWRAPTSWEIRHVVGEGSFTGLSGAQAAGLVGISPQNFRKYLASDTAKNRQSMSFAVWHLLLHKLGVKRIDAD